MGRLSAVLPVIVEPGLVVRAMSDRQLLEVVLRWPAQDKPCTGRGADRVEWLRPAVSRLADRQMAVREEMRARRLCAGCPVLGECLELSLRGAAVEGVQGGTTERSRQTLRRRRAARRGRPAGGTRGQWRCVGARSRPSQRRRRAGKGDCSMRLDEFAADIVRRCRWAQRHQLGRGRPTCA